MGEPTRTARTPVSGRPPLQGQSCDDQTEVGGIIRGIDVVSTVEQVGIGRGAENGKQVAAGASDQPVVAAPAQKRVGAALPVNHIVAATRIETVIAGVAGDGTR